MDLDNKRLCLLGFGVENRAVAAWLAQQGLPFTVCDTNVDVATSGPWEEAHVAWCLGPQVPALDDFDVLFRSPGIAARRADLVAARQAGVRISSGIELFLERCPGPVIGVTGTKGKGTTSSLLMSLLQAGSVPGRLGGNIGTPPLSFLNELGSNDRVVLELSSFQLQDLGRSPGGAVLLPIGSDHLDHHATRAEYVDAKGEICRHQRDADWALMAATCPTACELGQATSARQLMFSGTSPIEGDGCWVDGQHIRWRNGATEMDVTDISDVRIPGRHNLDNACAAVAAAMLAGVSADDVPAGLRSFVGLPHRLQNVGERAGVQYVNDSLATTPEAATAGVRAFPGRRVILIAGGSSKGADFATLGATIASDVLALVTMGAEGPRIVAAARAAGFRGSVTQDCGSMSEAVRAAETSAATGDVVLMSPGCASFGMFSNYAERGEAFGRALDVAQD